ncbi:MAG: DUF4358 domain-containing protein [Oscillospiraceae bacterium]|jgi:hypothetical protein|nr:DUF4358 domain-containing protein [Oscillospiraceae bacterium]
MKKIRFGILSLTLCLSLAACGGGKESSPFDPAADAQTLLAADGAFTSDLTAVEEATACALYGIDPDTVTGCAVYMGNTGVSLEELAIFTLTDGEAAEAALTALEYRLEDQKESAADYAGYLQNELPKLEGAVTRQRGNSVLLVIAADYGPVNDFLEADL